jgi:signal transduction histidine kinase
MDFNIFKNKFTLTYRSKTTEKGYSKLQYENLRKYGIYITLAFCLISLIACSLLIYHYAVYLGYNSYVKNLSFSCSISIIYLILLAVILRFKNPCTLYTANYYNFIVVFFLFSFFRYYLELMKNKEQIAGFILLILDFIFKLFLITRGTFNILDTLLLCVANCLMIIAFLLPTVPWSELKSYFIGYTCLLVLFLLTTYAYVFHAKSTFYYNTKLKNKAAWARGVIDNMSSGFVYVKNGKIKYINKMLTDKIAKARVISKPIWDFKQESFEILNYLLNDLYDEHDEPICSTDEILNRFKEIYMNEEGEVYRFAGIKKIDNLSIGNTGDEEHRQLNTSSSVEEYHFEVHYRFYKNDHGEDDFEFIFNDVTRTKLNEKRNAEFKFKTLYLAKVAHEFKNPLICINELSEQLIEKMNFQSSYDVDKITHSIKSLSNYLLILIKDLDYFSEKQQNEDKELNITEVNIDELISFCSDIANGLLKKARKELDVDIHVERNDRLCRSILSDEIKLKQVIVNLLSNSIKFTTRGRISIKVDLVNDHVRFTVQDTGKGINNTQDLFKPFKRGMGSDNKLGTGLGLSIVYDLCTKLGYGIRYSSIVGEGTRFWFDIPYNPSRKHLTCPERTYSGNYLGRKKSNNNKKRFIQSSLNVIRYKTYISPESRKSIASDNYSNETIELKNINFNTNLIQKYYNVNEYHIHNYGGSTSGAGGVSGNIQGGNNIINQTVEEEIDFCDKHKKRVIIVDDDYIVRESAIRIFKNLSEDVVIIEAEDGCEAIYQVYKNLKNGVDISCIISDESMAYINGTLLADVIHKFTMQKNLSKIYFFLLTGYNELVCTSNIDSVYKKPLNLSNLKEILKLIV